MSGIGEYRVAGRVTGAGLLIASTIYVPLFGQMSPAVRQSHVALAYAMALALYCVVVIRIMNTGLRLRDVWLPVVAGASFISIGLLHLDSTTDDLVPFLSQHFGLVLSVVLALYVVTFSAGQRQALLDRVVTLVAVAFVLQFAFSAYESYLGVYIAHEAEWLNERAYRDVLADRFIGNVVSRTLPQVLFLDRFTFPFTGILGQHNYWGTQLPFYNLLFLLQYGRRAEARWLVFSAGVLVAAVLNTSRFSIAAIASTDIVLFALTRLPLRDQRLVKWILATSVTGLLLVFIPVFVENAAAYFARQNTFTDRFDTYARLAGAYWQENMRAVLIGRSVSEFTTAAVRILQGVRSLESQFFWTAYYYGLAGLAVGAAAALGVTYQLKGRRGVYRFAGVLLVWNMLLVSVISNLLFHYSTLAIVTLIFLRARASGEPPPASPDVAFVKQRRPAGVGATLGMAPGNGLA